MDCTKPNLLDMFDRKEIKTKILTSARCTEIVQNKYIWWKQNLVSSLWGKYQVSGLPSNSMLK